MRSRALEGTLDMEFEPVGRGATLVMHLHLKTEEVIRHAGRDCHILLVLLLKCLFVTLNGIGYSQILPVQNHYAAVACGDGLVQPLALLVSLRSTI